MLSVSSASTAVLVLGRSIATPSRGGAADAAAPAARTAPGLTLGRDGPDLTEMKVALYERVGRELGVKMEDYDSPADYANALGKVVADIRAKPGSRLVLADLEHKLGLDDLGLSLDDVIDSLTNTQGQKKLNEALISSLGKHGKADGPQVSVDETGAYRVTRG